MEFLGLKFRLEVVAICVLLGYLIGGFLLCSCSKGGLREGLAVGLGSKHASAPVAALASAMGIEPDSAQSVESDWSAAAATAQAGVDKYNFLSQNVAGQVPLPEGQLDFFYDNQFKPECCNYGAGYSSSTGCACLSVKQAEYLNARGGNRAAPSIF